MDLRRAPYQCGAGTKHWFAQRLSSKSREMLKPDKTVIFISLLLLRLVKQFRRRSRDPRK